MGMIDYFNDLIKETLSRTFRKVEQDISERVDRQVSKIQRKVMKAAMFASLLILSIVLISIASVYFFIEYININNTLSFMIVGVVVLVISLLIKLFD